MKNKETYYKHTNTMKRILFLISTIFLLAACSSDDEVLLAPLVSGVEDAYTILEDAKLELNPNYTNIKVCPICGKEFKADEQSRKFCSKECVNKYNSKRPSDEELIIMFSSNKNIDELTKEYNVCKRTIST